MKITEYKKVKEYDVGHGTKNVTIRLINGTGALVLKNYNPDTGELLANETEIGIDVKALELQVDNLQLQMDNINELIADTKALTE